MIQFTRFRFKNNNSLINNYMPAKSEKQKRFFGAVMGAKKGQKSVTGAAKKAAKEMPKKEIKKFLKKESFNDTVNSILSEYFKPSE